jgi:hypothetical protein
VRPYLMLALKLTPQFEHEEGFVLFF